MHLKGWSEDTVGTSEQINNNFLLYNLCTDIQTVYNYYNYVLRTLHGYGTIYDSLHQLPFGSNENMYRNLLAMVANEDCTCKAILIYM